MTGLRRKNLLVSIGLVAVAALSVVIVLAIYSGDDDTTEAEAPGAAAVVRADSHRLSTPPPGSPVFVEFLDFECESCAAAFPLVEQLRATYGDRVEFVARYFPLDGHFNSRRAARAVEAAARQGEFEGMYQRMYATQSSWGEQQVALDDLFRSFAVDLGLDMARFDADYADPAVEQRVLADVADGKALGVSGTPTFFLDGERIEPRSADELVAMIETAIALRTSTTS